MMEADCSQQHIAFYSIYQRVAAAISPKHGIVVTYRYTFSLDDTGAVFSDGMIITHISLSNIELSTEL
jgi:hypothetical protein